MPGHAEGWTVKSSFAWAVCCNGWLDRPHRVGAVPGIPFVRTGGMPPYRPGRLFDAVDLPRIFIGPSAGGQRLIMSLEKLDLRLGQILQGDQPVARPMLGSDYFVELQL